MSSNFAAILTESSTGSTTTQDILRHVAGRSIFQAPSNILSGTNRIETLFAASNYMSEMIINSIGVGIGKEPTVALDVVGSINTTGSVSIGSGTIASLTFTSAAPQLNITTTSNIIQDIGIYQTPIAGSVEGTLSLVNTTPPPSPSGTGFATEPAIYFDGVAGNTISMSSLSAPFVSAQWNTTGMTIEAWVNYPLFTNASQTSTTTPTATLRPRLLGAMTPVGTTMYWAFGVGTDQKLVFNYSPTVSTEVTFTAQTTTIALNTWYHIAFVCAPGGATVYLFVNGIQQSIITNNNGTTAAPAATSAVIGTPLTASTSFAIGQYNSARPTVYLSSPRIVLGAALYTTAFTPSTTPLTTTSESIVATTVFLLRTSPIPGKALFNKLSPSPTAPLVRAYPSAAMTNNISDLTSSTTYAPGLYIATSSAAYSTVYPPYLSFNKVFVSGSSYWLSLIIYDVATGNYQGSTGTLDKAGTNYSGEWLQLQLPTSIKLNNYQLYPPNSVANTAVDWVVLASNDGMTWSPISAVTGTTGWVAGTPKTYSCVLPNAYSYFRIVCQKIGLQTRACFAEVVFNGTQEPINVTAEGNVGLGVVTPQEELEVGGNAVLGGYYDAVGGPIATTSSIPYIPLNGNTRSRDLFIKWMQQTTTPSRSSSWNNQTFRFSSVAGSVPVNSAFQSGVLLPDGRVYCVPSVSNGSGATFNPKTNILTTYAAAASLGGSASYSGVLLPNGNVYNIPTFTSTAGSIFNPSTNLLTSFVGAVNLASTYNFIGGALLPNGLVYCVPYNATAGGGLFNPTTNAFTSVIAAGANTGHNYWGGVLLPDGRVYCVPNASTGGGGLYNPQTNTFTSIITASSSPGSSIYRGGVLLSDGSVYTPPCNTTTGGGVFNPRMNTFSSNSVNGTSVAFLYGGGVLLPDGRVYCTPLSTTTGGGIYNPVTNVFSTSLVSGTAGGTSAYLGSVLLPDGRVYCVPDNTTGSGGGLLTTFLQPTWEHCYHPCFNKF